MIVQCLRALWRDERGMVHVSGYLLLVIFVASAGVIGLSTFRNSVIQQFGDVAVGLESLNQSYSFTVGTVTRVYVDPPTTLTDPAGAEPAGIMIDGVDATPE